MNKKLCNLLCLPFDPCCVVLQLYYLKKSNRGSMRFRCIILVYEVTFKVCNI